MRPVLGGTDQPCLRAKKVTSLSDGTLQLADAASEEQPQQSETTSAGEPAGSEATGRDTEATFGPIDAACKRLVQLRERALLVLYYPEEGAIERTDVRYCYKVLRQAGLEHGRSGGTLDVLLHTFGGDPVAAYQLAQCIRDFSADVTFVVPEYAYSAGTLLALAGSRIALGHCAGLSPIDMSLVYGGEPVNVSDRVVELASIESFIRFAARCQHEIQGVLSGAGVSDVSDVGSDLLCRLVEQVGALKVGGYFRQQALTGHYAQALLDAYMLNGASSAVDKRTSIVNALLQESPSHDFHVDYHMCQQIGLVAEELISEQSDAAKIVVDALDDLVLRGAVCPELSDGRRPPYIAFFPIGNAGHVPAPAMAPGT